MSSLIIESLLIGSPSLFLVAFGANRILKNRPAADWSCEAILSLI